MGLTVYGGGGKLEEEKTVTAGTSAIEVNPSSGKVMKKVTVNPTPTEAKEVIAGTEDTTVSPAEGKHISGVTVHPTPSQEKTVIPNADGFKVSPETGKLLSAVFVDGDSDLVAENIKEGVNIFGVDGSFDNSHGAYVWKKLTAQGGDFLDFVVSDDPTAYPDGGEQGGYWYERVVDGITGIDYGEVTFTSAVASFTAAHRLKVAPKQVMLIPKNVTAATNSDIYLEVSSTEKLVTYASSSYNVMGIYNLRGTHKVETDQTAWHTADAENFTLKGVGRNFAAGSYIWVAVA